MPVYELVNPSDPYTFEAPNIEVAGACACLLSSRFGARDVETDEQSPVLFGWDEWLKDRGINQEWIDAHLLELADAFDSFLIGSPATRADVKEMLALIPPEKQQQWKDSRQDRHRTSLSRIGEAAYQYAARFRKAAETADAEQAL